MKLTIQSVNFDASEQLKSFIEKKVKKLEHFSDEIIDVEVILKVVKPDSINNKDVSIKLKLRNAEAFANKKANTFEEAVDNSLEAVEKQIMKTKTKKR